MQALSIKGKSAEEIKITLAQAMVDDYNPTLAVVFIFVKQDRKAFVALLKWN